MLLLSSLKTLQSASVRALMHEGMIYIIRPSLASSFFVVDSHSFYPKSTFSVSGLFVGFMGYER